MKTLVPLNLSSVLVFYRWCKEMICKLTNCLCLRLALRGTSPAIVCSFRCVRNRVLGSLKFRWRQFFFILGNTTVCSQATRQSHETPRPPITANQTAVMHLARRAIGRTFSMIVKQCLYHFLSVIYIPFVNKEDNGF